VHGLAERAERALTVDPIALGSIIWAHIGGRAMPKTSKGVTRVDLYEAVHQKVGLPRTESSAFVELVLQEITDCLEKGETVKLSSFGSFMVRKKARRLGRNPKTGIEVPISPRRVVVFKPSAIMKRQIKSQPPGSGAVVGAETRSSLAGG
jgi:integration host factor subunit alpha